MKQTECKYYTVIGLVNGNTEVTGDLFIYGRNLIYLFRESKTKALIYLVSGGEDVLPDSQMTCDDPLSVSTPGRKEPQRDLSGFSFIRTLIPLRAPPP